MANVNTWPELVKNIGEFLAFLMTGLRIGVGGSRHSGQIPYILYLSSEWEPFLHTSTRAPDTLFPAGSEEDMKINMLACDLNSLR